MVIEEGDKRPKRSRIFRRKVVEKTEQETEMMWTERKFQFNRNNVEVVDQKWSKFRRHYVDKSECRNEAEMFNHITSK